MSSADFSALTLPSTFKTRARALSEGGSSHDLPVTIDEIATRKSLTDALWDHIFSFLELQDVLSVSQCSRRWNVLSLRALERLGLPDRKKAQEDVAEAIAIMEDSFAKTSFLRKVFRRTRTHDWSSHPFWTKKTSRLRLLVCGGFDKRIGHTGVAEMRLLHGKLRYYCLLFDAWGNRLFLGKHFCRRCIEFMLNRFVELTNSDFVVAFKDLSASRYRKVIAEISTSPDENDLSALPKFLSQNVENTTDLDETLCVDEEASLEFAYLQRNRVSCGAPNGRLS